MREKESHNGLENRSMKIITSAISDQNCKKNDFFAELRNM
jgi:hypothetical protein